MSTIAFDRLTKRYAAVTALADLTAQVRPGRVTAFLGANGSGKTTSMRVLLGLSAPDAGSATIGGRRYVDLPDPLRVVGAVLDQGFHPNRSARNHLRIVAAQARVPRSRVEQSLELVELTSAAGRRVGGFSLGMRQRLALAAALIGDPSVLVLDEPFNGLDPAGIATMRAFLRRFADDGGNVFLSSHLLAEVAHSADDAIIIDHGRLVSAGPVAALVGSATAGGAVEVSSPEVDLLVLALARRGARLERTGPDRITVTGLTREDVGRTAAAAGAVITGMRALGDDLESVFTALIHREAASATAYPEQAHPVEAEEALS
jgi:ABC-2 type transport system ATP-binding protein